MRLLRSSAIVAGFTMLSRILGFGRDILIARFLGTTGVVEAFVVAFRFPNFFRRLVAEGAFTAAFVPLFSKKLEKDGTHAAMEFADRVMAVLVVVLAIFTLFAEIFMPWLMRVIAPGFAEKPELFDTAVLFTRLTMPYLLCMALVGMMSGMLNSTYRFAAAAGAPILLNIILIAGLVFARDWFQTPAHMLSMLVTVSGIAQYILLAWACHRAGLTLRFPRPRLTPEVKRLLKLMIPGAIGAGMTQINLLVGTIIASFISGAVSILYFADRVYQFPLGMIGIAIGTALLPELSRTLASDAKAANGVQNRAVELSMLLTLPATAALIAIAEPIATVMFQYGRFTPEDAAKTGWALVAFSIGLPAYVLIKILNPGFYARHDTRTPVVFAVTSMVTNIVLSIGFVWPPFGLPSLGFVGIALATAIAAWLNSGLLALSLLRRGHWRIDRRLVARLPRVLAAAVAMGLALLPLAAWLDPWIEGMVWQRVLAMLALVISGMVVFAVLVLVLRGADTGDIKRILRRPRRKSKAVEADGDENG